MFKKTLMAASVATAMFAAQGAFAAAATVTQTATNETFAQELFGTGSDATVLTTNVGTPATVILTVGGAVDAGETADFTITLDGAQFGAAVALTDMVFVASATGDVTITKQSGGAAGDNTVTFRVQVDSALAATDTITLNLVALKAASSLSDVTTPEVVNATASIVQVSTSGVNTFPTSVTIAADADKLVVDSADEVDLVVNDGSDVEVDVDNRSDITTNAVAIDHDADAGTADLDGILVGDVEVALNAAGVQSDGTAFSVAAGEDGEGTLELSVSGTFNSGDIVFLDLNGDDVVDAGETFTISGATATLSVDLDDVDGAGALNVYYVANGTDTLVPTTYTLTASTAYANSTMLTETETGSATSSYSGLTLDGYAMAIPGSASADIANVRVTNETSGDVSLFAQGYAQDGTDLGFKELTTLSANQTVVLNAGDFEAAFGTWTGRARFEFSRSGDISVQTMIRSGGILNNMTGEAGVTGVNVTR